MFRNDLGTRVLALPRAVKRLIVLGVDAAICVGTVWLAFYLRIGIWPSFFEGPAFPISTAVAIAIPLFVSFGLYRAIFRYAGWTAITTIAQSVVLYTIPFAGIFTLIGIPGVPRTIGLIQPILLFLFIAGSRVFARGWLGEVYQVLWRQADLPQVLIYGAGSAGRQLASAIQASQKMVLVGFIDDSPELSRFSMGGLEIFGPSDVPAVIEKRGVTDVLLAIPSASRTRRSEILNEMKAFGLHVRTLPAVLDIARGKVSVSDLKELDIEDLLGRAPIPPDEALLKQNIADKVVMITGAGGSIGSELCRQIAAIGPRRLLLVDVNEFGLYEIHQQLQKIADGAVELFPLLASVRDRERMARLIATWRPDTIYHAAAYKHVPLVEHNVIEGILNNSFGTLTVAQLARENGVSNFVLVSTDKAVRPTNIMGASKRLAELVLQAIQAEGGGTCFSMVRFGNVLGSSGSVVPLFRRQIAAGGPVTITDIDVTRYFMTISEAAQLVLQAGAMSRGGDVFVLDMGEPVRIIDLARNMIELSGLTVRGEDNPTGDIEIQTVGLRPGEKLYEELLIGNNPAQSSHPRILQADEQFYPWRDLEARLDRLKAAIDAGDIGLTCEVLGGIVIEYQPVSPVVDLVTLALAKPSAKVQLDNFK